MSHNHSPVHRQILMSAEVTNPHGQTTRRWIDRQIFFLWREFMQTHHGFAVKPGAAYVWVSELECSRHPAVIARMASSVRVSRLSYETYQPDLGTSVIRNRFVEAHDKALVMQKLGRHFDQSAAPTELCVTAGLALAGSERQSSDPLTTSLTTADSHAA